MKKPDKAGEAGERRLRLASSSAAPSMNPRAESSALISLEELLTLEQARIRDEEAKRRASEELVLRERLAAEAKAAEAERARVRAEEESRREATRLEEARKARIEAESLAAVARAKVLAESQAKHELFQLAHKQTLERDAALLEVRVQRAKGRRVLAGCLVSFMVLSGVFFGLWMQDEAKLGALKTSLDGVTSERDLRAREASERVPKSVLDSALARAQRAEDELATLRSQTKAPSSPGASGSPSPGGPGIKVAPKNPANDPCAFYRKLRETDPHDPRLFDPTNGCL